MRRPMSSTFSTKSSFAVCGVAALVAAGLTGFAAWQKSGGPLRVEKAGSESADAPLSMPAEGGPELRLLSLSAWDAANLPVAGRFSPPLGTEGGGFVQVTRRFQEKEGEDGPIHTGVDYHGIGGKNVGLGDPVFAAADGKVVYTGTPSAEWGNVVVLSHRLPDGDRVQTVYGHLEGVEVERGAIVSRGARLGAVGTADGFYPAHLHFEVRQDDGVAPGSLVATAPQNRIDPLEQLKRPDGEAAEDLPPPPLSKM